MSSSVQFRISPCGVKLVPAITAWRWWRCVSVPVELLAYLLNVRADLEGGPQFDGHGAHEMVRLEQHQGLTIDFLGSELLDILGTAGQRLDKVTHLAHVPFQRIGPLQWARCRRRWWRLCHRGGNYRQLLLLLMRLLVQLWRQLMVVLQLLLLLWGHLCRRVAITQAIGSGGAPAAAADVSLGSLVGRLECALEAARFV